MSDKINCPACGKEIKAIAKHCGYCGAKIESKLIADPIKTIAEDTSVYVDPVDIAVTGGVRGVRNTTSIILEEKPIKEKWCPVCKKTMAAKAKFCGICGGALVEVPDERTDISTTDTSKTSVTSGKHHPAFHEPGDL